MLNILARSLSPPFLIHCCLLWTFRSETILIYPFRLLAAVCQFIFSFIFKSSSIYPLQLFCCLPLSFLVPSILPVNNCFGIFLLFVFSVFLRHINISDFMNFTLSLHKGECKIYIIYPLFVLILQLFSFL